MKELLYMCRTYLRTHSHIYIYCICVEHTYGHIVISTSTVVFNVEGIKVKANPTSGWSSNPPLTCTGVWVATGEVRRLETACCCV